MIGFFNVLKPVGWTSNNVVCAVRRFLTDNGLADKNVKVGHTGTLDPGGSGVLPVAFGKATRLFAYMTEKVKTYRAEFVFGTETDTLDAYGKVTATGRIPTAEEIEAAKDFFVGDIEQTPPQFSAKSVNGVRAYDLARQGVKVDLKPAKVTVFSIETVRSANGKATFDITCGAGVYIRSLVRDIAEKLGTVGYMSYIIRTKSGVFDLENAVTLDELSAENVIPPEVAFPLPVIGDLPSEVEFALSNGVPQPTELENGLYYIKKDGEILGVATAKDGVLQFTTRLL